MTKSPVSLIPARSYARAVAILMAALAGMIATPASFAATAPTADVSASTTRGPAPLSVLFKGHGSSDRDGRIVDYRWDLAGASGSGIVTNHTFNAPGKYLVTLTVTDDAGLSDTSEPVTIEVLGSGGDGGGSSNSAPTISGTAPGSVVTGQSYSFTPSASDADGDSLTFAIQNKPSWATFSSATGRLSGTPAAGDVGNYSNIGITVTDGSLSSSLQSFSISVVAVTNGSVTLSWTPPTQNVDGSTLTDLAGYRIAYGTSSSNLSQLVSLMNPGLSSAVIENLTAGTWYFAVKAVNKAGVESNLSNMASKSVK